MLDSSLLRDFVPLQSFDSCAARNQTYDPVTIRSRPPYLGDEGDLGILRRDTSTGILHPTVEIASRRSVLRYGMKLRGIGAEIVQAPVQNRVECSFRSPMHLLAAYEQGVRRDGVSYVESVPRSTLRDLAKKLTFVPAGHEYQEWHDLRTPVGITYFYFDPAELQIDSDENLADIKFAPRLLFEDDTIWSTAAKLKQAMDTRSEVNRLYVEALGVVLFHELVRINRGVPRVEVPIRGGLAAWQQRIVIAYVEEHLSEQIPLAKLARLARLSTFHFCRAFKQSFGVPPHRYHTNQRIERAKVMLAERKHSVTEVGLTLGYSETSSFTAVFRKVTGQPPSHYHRNLG
jgi:AraC family transcriptional regulator